MNSDLKKQMTTASWGTDSIHSSIYALVHSAHTYGHDLRHMQEWIRLDLYPQSQLPGCE